MRNYIKMGLYTVYDRVAEQSGPLFESLNDGVAMRSFKMIVVEKDASEYKLLCVGEVEREPLKITIYEEVKEVVRE
jgi:hypothetical protein